MKRVRLRPLLMLAFLVASTAGAGPARQAAPKKVGVRGVVKQVWFAQNKHRPDQMLIHGRLEADTQVDRALVTVNSGTKVFLLKRGKRHPIGPRALKRGIRVQVLFTGPVMESYPVQATAGEIDVLPSMK